MSSTVLDGVTVAGPVWQLQPDYQVQIVIAEGLTPGASDEVSERMLSDAETTATHRLGDLELPDVEVLAAWRAAYRSFGAKPQRTRPSVEALLRRLPAGLPRINRLTDIYNAISITHLLPVGSEDLSTYAGVPRLERATGNEEFDSHVDGQLVTDHPEVGEVVWRDDRGVTCRRWNWRQCQRARLTDATTTAIFYLDWLPASSPNQTPLAAAGHALTDALTTTSPGVRLTTRTITCPT